MIFSITIWQMIFTALAIAGGIFVTGYAINEIVYRKFKKCDC